MKNAEDTFRILNCRILKSDDEGETGLVDLFVSRGRIRSIRNASDKIVPPAGRGRRKNLRPRDYDAKGRLALPAFIDCHCHLFSLAEEDEIVQLKGCKSISEMQERIKAFLNSGPGKERKKKWIGGRGWDQDLFADKRMPTKADLDLVVADVPCVMTRICGHIAVMNSNALKFFSQRGILDSADSELLPVDSQGSPTGIVKESLLAKCWDAAPQATIKELQTLFLRAQSKALRFGLSGVHCILDDLAELEAIKKLDAREKVRLKVSLLLPIDVLGQIEGMGKTQRSSLLRRGKKVQIIGFKLFLDGSLGARTAALNNEYSDDAGNSGVLYYEDSRVADFARRVKRLHLTLAAHAIGDRAVEQAARAYRSAGISKKDGFRIEHCSVVRPGFIEELDKTIVSVQPMFATSDYWLNERIGTSRSRRVGYPFKSLGEKAALLVGGSDAPVESLDPFTGIAAAMDNRANPSESLTLSGALNLYTKNAATLSPLTKNSGSIAKGRSCDLVILDTSDPKHIQDSQVFELFIDGARRLD